MNTLFYCHLFVKINGIYYNLIPSEIPYGVDLQQISSQVNEQQEIKSQKPIPWGVNTQINYSNNQDNLTSPEKFYLRKPTWNECLRANVSDSFAPLIFGCYYNSDAKDCLLKCNSSHYGMDHYLCLDTYNKLIRLSYNDNEDNIYRFFVAYEGYFSKNIILKTLLKGKYCSVSLTNEDTLNLGEKNGKIVIYPLVAGNIVKTISTIDIDDSNDQNHNCWSLFKRKNNKYSYNHISKSYMFANKLTNRLEFTSNDINVPLFTIDKNYNLRLWNGNHLYWICYDEKVQSKDEGSRSNDEKLKHKEVDFVKDNDSIPVIVSFTPKRKEFVMKSADVINLKLHLSFGKNHRRLLFPKHYKIATILGNKHFVLDVDSSEQYYMVNNHQNPKLSFESWNE